MTFKEWVVQEETKDKINKAVRDGTDEFSIHLIRFVSTALRISSYWIENLPWEIVLLAFYKSLVHYPVIDIPITQSYKRDDTESKEDWDYEDRTWHFYSHLIASSYGWELGYIENLPVKDALCMVQEILTQEQLDKEFYYSLSEVAYPYDKSTKKSSFRPLKRPMWMSPKIKEVPRFKMPLSSLPIGNVNYEALPEELRPQETIH